MPMAYGYVRVSSERQVRSGLGMDAQKETIKKYFEYRLKSNGFEWGDFWIDPAKSGNIPFQQRPAGGKLDLAMTKGDAIIVAKLDRAFRRALDFYRMMEIWEERGIHVHMLDLGMDSSTPVGKMLMGMLAVIAEFERSRLRERVMEAKAQMKKNGRPTNQYCGFGNKAVGHGNRRRAIPDPYEREWIQKIVEKKLQGFSFDKIWRWLWLSRVKNSKGQEWSRTRIERVFNDEMQKRANMLAHPEMTPTDCSKERGHWRNPETGMCYCGACVIAENGTVTLMRTTE